MSPVRAGYSRVRIEEEATTRHRRRSPRRRGDGGFDPYLGRVIGQAEDDVSAALDSFGVVQPPLTDADAIRTEVDELVRPEGEESVLVGTDLVEVQAVVARVDELLH